MARAGGYIVDYYMETYPNGDTWNCLVWNDGWHTWLLDLLNMFVFILIYFWGKHM